MHCDFSEWQVVLLGALLIVGYCAAVNWLGRRIWRGLQWWAKRRAVRRVDDFGPRYVGRIVRHAPSGKIGFCVQAGFSPHLRWGALRPKFQVGMVTCPICAAAAKKSPFFCNVFAPMTEHFALCDLSEVVSALACEAAEFSEQMQEGNPE